MPESFACKDFGFELEGNSLTDLLSATMFALDNELIQEKDLKCRRALVEAEYKLKDLLYTHLQKMKTSPVRSGIVLYNN